MIKSTYTAVLLATGLASAAAFAQSGPSGTTPSPQGLPESTQRGPASPHDASAPPVPTNTSPSAATATAPAVTAGDAARGREKTQMCQGCHGIEGWRTAYPEVYRVPMIGGQHEAYIVKALQAYKTGERTHPSMRGIAAS